MEIGVIGLGAMGKNIAANLLKAGYSVKVWNRSPGPVEEAVRAGATPAATVREVFACLVVLSVLFDDASVREVLLAEDVLPNTGQDTVHVCMSTISTSLVETLIEAHNTRGIRYVAAPMFGRPDMAAAARLNMVTAGDPQALSAVAPVLSALGTMWNLGDDPRIGHLAKIAGNFMIGCAIEAMAESSALIASQGGDPGPFLSMLGETLFDAPIYKSYGSAIARNQSSGAPSGLALPLKDVGLTLGEGRRAGLHLPLADLLRQRLESAAEAGMMDDDWSVALAANARRGDMTFPA